MPTVSWPEIITRLLARQDLDEVTSAVAMSAIMSGEATPAQVAGFVVALRAKGVSAAELVGLARTMREFSRRVPVEGPVVDTCGTGGDRAGTVNISTMAALVVAGAGARVAKHGNRAASSACGSADVLEALGVVIDLEPAGVAACIDEAGIGFCFAPVFHPAMRHAGGPRRELGVPTVFNFLGPLTNPAGARYQTIGVSDGSMAPLMASALGRLGTLRAFVFRGDDGLDELTTTTTSRLWELDQTVSERSFDPASVGIPRATLADLAGGDAETNRAVAERLLSGEAGPVRDAVCLNAAAALVAASIADDFGDGLERAAVSIDSGAARKALDRLREVSRRFRK